MYIPVGGRRDSYCLEGPENINLGAVDEKQKCSVKCSPQPN